MTAITLTKEEKAIAERQCDGCLWWSWFKGCQHLLAGFNNLPREDCRWWSDIEL